LYHFFFFLFFSLPLSFYYNGMASFSAILIFSHCGFLYLFFFWRSRPFSDAMILPPFLPLMVGNHINLTSTFFPSFPTPPLKLVPPPCVDLAFFSLLALSFFPFSYFNVLLFLRICYVLSLLGCHIEGKNLFFGCGLTLLPLPDDELIFPSLHASIPYRRFPLSRSSSSSCKRSLAHPNKLPPPSKSGFLFQGFWACVFLFH